VAISAQIRRLSSINSINENRFDYAYQRACISLPDLVSAKIEQIEEKEFLNYVTDCFWPTFKI